ncbi:MAG: VCBS repeat-containing protein [Rhodospirillales bacterium]|nr:VCBS repeat-containing protein [Rhodospirillales bacterium]
MVKSKMTSSLALALLAATCLTPPDSARAEPGDPLGGQLTLNSLVPSGRSHSAVGLDDDGDFVVAWEGAGIRARRFDALGTALGPEFAVNTYTQGVKDRPALAVDAEGDFVVVWEDFGQDGDGFGIFARRYDAAGTPQEDVEFQVNTTTAHDQRAPAVAMDVDGNFVVAWVSYSPGDSEADVFARRYNAAGVPQEAEEFQVNTVITTFDQTLPAVAMDADGNFVVTWVYIRAFDDSLGIFARRYNAAGAAQEPEIWVNSIGNEQRFSSVAMDADGDFVVAWESRPPNADYDILARRFDAAGEAQGPGEFRVNSYAAGNQRFPVIAIDADGDFVVTWQSYGQDGNGYGVFAQRYNAAGVPQKDELPVNSNTAGDQWVPSVAMDADGDLVVVWSSFDLGGDGVGVLAQRYQGDGPVPSDFTVDGRSDILWRHADTGNAILWQMNGFAKETSASIGAPGTDWEVAGIADFNADTKADILWRNTATGGTVIWQMDGFTKSAAAGIGAPPLVWQVDGTGDFDGDDHADILWRNTSTGAALIWQMDGFVKEAVGGIGTVPLAWQVAGIGDFDADAKSDILWRNTGTGAAVIWQMDGFAKDASGGIGTVPFAWQVRGLGDFDADAKSDILWRNTSTGSTVIWKMNGLTKEAGASIGAVPLVWDLEGAGDSDGDRKADILWRNTGTGNTLVWKMDGFVTEAVGGIGSVPVVWEVQ